MDCCCFFYLGRDFFFFSSFLFFVVIFSDFFHSTKTETLSPTCVGRRERKVSMVEYNLPSSASDRVHFSAPDRRERM